MSLNLPPADKYRAPFVEPIGHLTMQAAHAESAMIDLCFAAAPKCKTRREEIAASLRNWNSKAALRHIEAIDSMDLREQARAVVERYTVLGMRRNRAVHDSIEVAIDEEDTVGTISVEYRKDKSTSSVHYNDITPQDVAALAYEMYELQKDINFIADALGRDSD